MQPTPAHSPVLVSQHSTTPAHSGPQDGAARFSTTDTYALSHTLSEHVHARALPLCNRSWLQVARDTKQALKPPAISVGALSQAQIDRARGFQQVRSAGLTFDHNGFMWRKPESATDTQLRQHYAMVVREPGVRAGYIEVCALAEALGIKISLWDVKRTWKPRGQGYGEFLGAFGDEDAVASSIAIGVIGETHYRALLPHAHKATYHETEAGGLGECLFLAVRKALQPYGGALANITAAQLRDTAADQIFANPDYDDRVRAVTEQAVYEHALPNIWQQFVARVRHWTR